MLKIPHKQKLLGSNVLLFSNKETKNFLYLVSFHRGSHGVGNDAFRPYVGFQGLDTERPDASFLVRSHDAWKEDVGKRG